MSNTVELKAVISAKDEASAKMNKIGTNLSGVAKKIGVVGVAAVGAGIAMGGIFIKQSIDAAKEEEVAMAKVNAILDTLTINMDDATDAIDRAGIAAINLGFDDEAAKISMAKLLQVTGDTENAMLANMAAMDLARFKGIELESATQAITMAYAGNLKLLKQLGIEIPENASKEEVLGLILDKVGGQAVAFGNTAAGAQAKLAVSIENVKEKFGAALVVGLNPFINKLTAWINDPKTQTMLTNLATTLGNIATQVFPVMISAINTMSNAWNSIINTLSIVIQKFWDVGNAVKSVTDKKPSWLHNNPVDTIKDILGLQMGGSANAGTPYVVGEAGPELFVPKTSGTVVPNNKLGGGVTLNISGNSFGNRSDIDYMIAQIKRALNRDLSLEGLRV